MENKLVLSVQLHLNTKIDVWFKNIVKNSNKKIMYLPYDEESTNVIKELKREENMTNMKSLICNII